MMTDKYRTVLPTDANKKQDDVKSDLFVLFVLTVLLLTMPGIALTEEGKAEEESKAGIELSQSQMDLAGIKVARLTARSLPYQVYAPGEVLANGYTSYLVSARVASVILHRHAILGDQVKKGQPLVTLFSDAVAEAQAAFRVSDAEFSRVKELGRKNVGARRFIQAKNDFEASYSRLLAFGLSEQAIAITKRNTSQIGEYTLVAMVDGVILSDRFRQGQRVEAGDALMEIASEDELWVEARLTPDGNVAINDGTTASLVIAGDRFPARVIQKAHTIDEITRTRVVRLLVRNEAYKLHPGQYADVYFNFNTDEPVLAVPETALMRSADGDWLVFVEEEPGYFVPHEVELGRALGDFREISGVEAGRMIIMKGAFFLASENAKSGFDSNDH